MALMLVALIQLKVVLWRSQCLQYVWMTNDELRTDERRYRGTMLDYVCRECRKLELSGQSTNIDPFGPEYQYRPSSMI
jgi:hypothetical protein